MLKLDQQRPPAQKTNRSSSKGKRIKSASRIRKVNNNSTFRSDTMRSHSLKSLRGTMKDKEPTKV